MKSFEILDPGEITRALTSIFNLENYWLSREPKPLTSYTLGCATYLDAVHSYLEYEKKARITNPILIENFDWLYKKITTSISHKFGEMVIHPNLAHPGFHIFGARLKDRISEQACRLMEKPIASVHVDIPYRNHMNFWKSFKDIDFLNPLSITLCLSLPESGGGLNVWHKLNKTAIFQGHEMIDFNFNRTMLTDPEYIPYTTGFIYVSSGHRIHQIAPANQMLPTDRRITLQAHALKCDGIWQLFF